MNLTDGSINCGRKNFDGSGGNNHAVDHYAETKYPLVFSLMIKDKISLNQATIYVNKPSLSSNYHH